MTARTVAEYYSEICTLVAEFSLDAETRKIKQVTPHKSVKTKGKLYSTEPIELLIGGSFQFAEDIEIAGTSVSRLKYTYEFRRDGFYFRYDKSMKGYIPYRHEECHLHVNSDAPRYITHETSFEQILRFVVTTYTHMDEE